MTLLLIAIDVVREAFARRYMIALFSFIVVFIAGLAFGPGELLEASKLAILCASLVSGVVGWALLRRWADRYRRAATKSSV